VIANKEMQPSAVTSAHFEAIECRERLVNRESNRNRGRMKWLACSRDTIKETSHTLGGSEAIALHCPDGVFEVHDSGVQSLEFDPNQSNVPIRVRVKTVLKFDNLSGKTIDQRDDRRTKARDFKQGPNSCDPAKQLIGGSYRLRSIGNWGNND
jgi:hypothetical protein